MSPDRPSSSDATGLLIRMSDGDLEAQHELLPLVYRELRALAAGFAARQGAGRSLQATELVHEAYIRLIRNPAPQWQGRGHFMAVAATAMRHVLVDQARRRASQKRGGDWHRVTLTGVANTDGPQTHGPEELLALDSALARLAELNPRHARVVELRAFAGMSNPEVAESLGLALRTVEKDWRLAKAWLARELGATR